MEVELGMVNMLTLHKRLFYLQLRYRLDKS